MEPNNKVITIENANYEQLVQSKTALALQQQLKLSDQQIAKGNIALLNCMNNDKLAGCSNISLLRYCYMCATLNYTNTNAIAPIKYGNNVQSQLQYQAYLEDMASIKEVKDSGVMTMYKEIKYDVFINKYGYKEIRDNETKLEDPFISLTPIGYYAYAKLENGKVITCLMSVQDIKNWATKYSNSYRAHSGIWIKEFEAMSKKTCLKSVAREVLKLYPSERLNKSIQYDQAVYTQKGVEYLDNPNYKNTPKKEQKEQPRIGYIGGDKYELNEKGQPIRKIEEEKKEVEE